MRADCAGPPDCINMALEIFIGPLDFGMLIITVGPGSGATSRISSGMDSAFKVPANTLIEKCPMCLC